MSINLFLSIIAAIMLSIFIFYKPLELAKYSNEEVPVLELNNFKIYEILPAGLSSIVTAEEGDRYKDNTLVMTKATYIDEHKGLLERLRSNEAVYKNSVVIDGKGTIDNVIVLNGDVQYVREDGLTFTSDDAQHYERLKVTTTQGPFTLKNGKNLFEGINLYFDDANDHIKANEVYGIYNMVPKDTK